MGRAAFIFPVGSELSLLHNHDRSGFDQCSHLIADFDLQIFDRTFGNCCNDYIISDLDCDFRHHIADFNFLDGSHQFVTTADFHW